MAKNETTGKKAASEASKLLKVSKSKAVKTVAGSDLTQRPDKKKSKKGK